MTAVVRRVHAPSGNRDHDYFQAECRDCGWFGVPYGNRTIEGRVFADRDAAAHKCPAKATS